MYGSIARNRAASPDARAVSLKRPEWQQPADMLPPLTTRLPGQRRRRVLGSFPETESDVSRRLRHFRVIFLPITDKSILIDEFRLPSSD